MLLGEVESAAHAVDVCEDVITGSDLGPEKIRRPLGSQRVLEAPLGVPLVHLRIGTHTVPLPPVAMTVLLPVTPGEERQLPRP